MTSHTMSPAAGEQENQFAKIHSIIGMARLRTLKYGRKEMKKTKHSNW